MASEHRVPCSRLRPQQIMSPQSHHLCPVASAITRFATTAVMSRPLRCAPLRFVDEVLDPESAKRDAFAHLPNILSGCARKLMVFAGEQPPRQMTLRQQQP